eukprot:scaffold167235_cov31-Tisochrysis_lutea.AAC.2
MARARASSIAVALVLRAYISVPLVIPRVQYAGEPIASLSWARLEDITPSIVARWSERGQREIQAESPSFGGSAHAA